MIILFEIFSKVSLGKNFNNYVSLPFCDASSVLMTTSDLPKSLTSDKTILIDYESKHLNRIIEILKWIL